MTYILGMVGTTFRRAGQAELQRFTLDVSEHPETLSELHRVCGFNESVYLATCNRVEIIFTAPLNVSVGECRRRLHAFFHRDVQQTSASADEMQVAARAFHAYESDGAAEHLFVVSAALDSMNPGEAQILGQVKAAYKQATELGLAGTQLQWVFEEAFSAAKKVRHDTRLGTGTVSMLSLARDLLERRLGGGKTLAVVGVGDMAHQCGAMFQGRSDTQLLFVNRTLSRAEELARTYGGRAQALEAFLASPVNHDALVTSTASPQPLFGSAFFGRLATQPLVIDLALQRDVEPAAAIRAGAQLYDIDRLRDLAQANRQERHAEVAEARAMLDDALHGFRRRLIEREMAPVVKVLRQHFQHTLESDLETFFARVLPDCDARQQAQVRQWAQTLVNRLAHVPTVGLKRIAVEHGSSVVEGFLEAVGEAADGLKGE